MKAYRKTSILFASLAVLAAIILCFGTPTIAFAETGVNSEFVIRKGNANNFVYSAEFADLSVADAGFVFGVSDDLASYWKVVTNAVDGKIELLKNDMVLKSAQYSFESGKQFALTVVVNEGVVKVFSDGSNVSLLTCKLDDYSGGKVGVINSGCTVINEQFASTDTPDGDIFCNGYTVLKVINVTDGHYKLESSQYSMNAGVLKIEPEYLKTLEANTVYTFRAVTSFTDFNFSVTTDFTPIAATSVLNKYYRGSDVTFELSSNVAVSKILVDGKAIGFTQNGNRVVISSEVAGDLATGQHTATLYTDLGRPEAKFTVSELVETLTEMEPEATHTFFWIDISIFGALILAYVAFTVVKKTKK